METAILSQDRVPAKPALRVQIVLVVRRATLEVLVIDVSLAIPATPIVKNVSSNLTMSMALSTRVPGFPKPIDFH